MLWLGPARWLHAALGIGGAIPDGRRGRTTVETLVEPFTTDEQPIAESATCADRTGPPETSRTSSLADGVRSGAEQHIDVSCASGRLRLQGPHALGAERRGGHDALPLGTQPSALGDDTRSTPESRRPRRFAGRRLTLRETHESHERDPRRWLAVFYRETCIGMLAWGYPHPTDRMPGSWAPQNVVALRSLPPLMLGSPSPEGKLRAKLAFRLYRECDRGAGGRLRAAGPARRASAGPSGRAGSLPRSRRGDRSYAGVVRRGASDDVEPHWSRQLKMPDPTARPTPARPGRGRCSVACTSIRAGGVSASAILPSTACPPPGLVPAVGTSSSKLNYE